MKRNAIFGIILVFILLIAGGYFFLNNPGDNTQENIKSEGGVLNKITTAFSSDVVKIKKELKALNDENQTFFTEVDISKDGNIIKMEFIVTEDANSQFILNILTLSLSLITYETTQDFEKIEIVYLNEKKKQLGVMIIPKKAVADLANYRNENENEDLLKNPYLEAFWKLSNIMYDQSVPELFPTAVANEMFGNNAEEIAEALGKEVTHLNINCGYGENWDADADTDGITFNLELLSADNTAVPLEGTFEVKGYERVPVGEYGWDTEQGKLVYTRTDTLEGEERFDYFDSYSGYSIALDWGDVEYYGASSEDEGILFVTFTDKDGNVFSAKTGDESYSDCQLRES